MPNTNKSEYRLVLLVQYYDKKAGWVGKDAMSFYTAGTREQVEEARKDILTPNWRDLMPDEDDLAEVMGYEGQEERERDDDLRYEKWKDQSL